MNETTTPVIMVINIDALEVGMIVSAVSEVLTIDDVSHRTGTSDCHNSQIKLHFWYCPVDSRLISSTEYGTGSKQSEKNQ
jgi:hypothetical protein